METKKYFKCTTDRSPLDYHIGEKMVFSLTLWSEIGAERCAKIKWRCMGDDGVSSSGVLPGDTGEPVTIEVKCDKPGFVHLVAEACDEDGNPLENSDVFEGGAGADLHNITCSTEIPEDFDAFWKQRTDELDACAFDILEKIELKDEKHPDFNVYDLKVDCPGGMPISGYLTIPKNAEKNSLSAAVHYIGYGVSSSPMVFKNNSISFGINAHGIENGRNPEFYEHLKSTVYGAYGFNSSENQDPETVYFKGMILRALGALRFVKSLPEWNKKELSCIGGSQGAFQAISAAAHDTDVTFCDTHVPWFCDMNSKSTGRMPGWRPEYAPGLRYYDTAVQATRVKCPVTIIAGLGDYICPPSGVVTLYHNIKSKKKLRFIQGKTHAYEPPVIASYDYK